MKRKLILICAAVAISLSLVACASKQASVEVSGDDLMELKHISKNVEVTVTSVLQTAAGRMIFTKLKEDVEYEIHAVTK